MHIRYVGMHVLVRAGLRMYVYRQRQTDQTDQRDRRTEGWTDRQTADRHAYTLNDKSLHV